MKYLLLLLAVSCGLPEYSPWQSNTKYSGLTQKHLAMLEDQDKDSFKIAVTGDPQAVVGHLGDVIHSTNKLDVDFVVILGDITDLGLKREWDWIGGIIEESNKPVLTVVGNHDGLVKGPKIYRKMFGELNYSFTYNGVKFIMWNNNYYEWGRPDFKWLQGEVNSHNRVVILSHQPPYSGTLKDEDEKVWQDIRKNPNVIASLHGHMHNYGFFIEEETNVPVYTVDRVVGNHFGTVEFTKDKVNFQNCTPICEGVE